MDDAMLKIILALIGLLGTVITYIVVPFIKTRTTKEQRDNVQFWTETAVVAIEKYYEGQSQKGPLKKEFVIDFVKKQGFNISEDQLNILIDAIVEEIINKPQKELDQDE